MAEKKKIERQYLTALKIVGGIITLIEPDGGIGHYYQRGMQRVKVSRMKQLISVGAVDARWESLKELPKHYTISFEDPEIMGRAYASFRIK